MELLVVGVAYHDEYVLNEFYARHILIRSIRGTGWGFPEFERKPNQSLAKSFRRRLTQETEGRYRVTRRKQEFEFQHEDRRVLVYTFDFEGTVSSKSGIGYVRVVNDVMPYQFTTLARITLNMLPQPELKRSPRLWQVPAV